MAVYLIQCLFYFPNPSSGYVDPATLPVIPAANSSPHPGGPPAAKKVRRFMEQSQMGKEGDGK